MLKTIFLGTPALAVPFLERLHQKTKVAAVITAPDQPAGRGYALKPPEVKAAALQLGLLRYPTGIFEEPLTHGFAVALSLGRGGG